jgi:hypothetical protein
MHEKAQWWQAQKGAKAGKNTRIHAKAGADSRKGREEMAHRQARKGAKACKKEAKGRFKKRKGWKANNGAQVGKIRSKDRLERQGTSPDKKSSKGRQEKEKEQRQARIGTKHKGSRHE